VISPVEFEPPAVVTEKPKPGGRGLLVLSAPPVWYSLSIMIVVSLSTSGGLPTVPYSSKVTIVWALNALAKSTVLKTLKNETHSPRTGLLKIPTFIIKHPA